MAWIMGADMVKPETAPLESRIVTELGISEDPAMLILI